MGGGTGDIGELTRNRITREGQGTETDGGSKKDMAKTTHGTRREDPRRRYWKKDLPEGPETDAWEDMTSTDKPSETQQSKGLRQRSQAELSS